QRIPKGETTMKNKIWLLAGAAILVGARLCIAAEPPKLTPEQQAAMEKTMKLSSPSENHKSLDPMVGKWTAKVRYWMNPGDKAAESNGASENGWVLGGRFVKQDYHGMTANGQPFEGIGLTGYDNVKGEYQTLWIDNMMTGMMLGSGTYD